MIVTCYKNLITAVQRTWRLHHDSCKRVSMIKIPNPALGSQTMLCRSHTRTITTQDGPCSIFFIWCVQDFEVNPRREGLWSFWYRALIVCKRFFDIRRSIASRRTNADKMPVTMLTSPEKNEIDYYWIRQELVPYFENLHWGLPELCSTNDNRH